MVKATISQTNEIVSTEVPVEKIKKKPGRKPGQKNKPSSKKALLKIEKLKSL